MVVAYDDRHIDGIRVETYGEPGDSPPLLFVHGGCQGSWAWEKMAPRLAEAGWYAVCLNWYGHHGSAMLPESQALTRSLLDVTAEIAVVAESLDRAPILVAHSMGAVLSLAYAAANPVTALTLLAPVLPAGFGADPIDLVVDPTSMWTPPPGMVRSTFWADVTDDESQRYESLLVAESPRAVLQATRWLCEVELSAVRVPALVIAAGADDLIPGQVQSLAEAIGAKFMLLEGEGHGIPVNPIWAQVTAELSQWLSR